jgi:TetR/AcrR family transcriptional repressor of bet genes
VPNPVTAKNFASRNRRHQSEYRKRQLIEATIDCIDRLGISQTTLARIADRAGVSQGNLVFHFQNKETLLEQTLDFLNDEYMQTWQEALRKAGPDPVARLRALLGVPFEARVCSRKKLSVWFAYWGESRSRPGYLKVCGNSDQAFSDTLLALCRTIEVQYGASLEAETAALAIESMIDGLWQNLLINAPTLKREEAKNAVLKLVATIYPGLAGLFEKQM